MSDVTRILNAIEQGDPRATEQLLPLVYDELRLLAAQKMSQEPPGQTLQATALVHEAYLRLAGAEDRTWDNTGHFFKAAAEAMRRILIEAARRKKSLRAGGEFDHISIHESEFAADGESDDLLALDGALQKLEAQSPRKAQVVKLRYFAGLTIPQTAEALGIAPSTAIADWSDSAVPEVSRVTSLPLAVSSSCSSSRVVTLICETRRCTKLSRLPSACFSISTSLVTCFQANLERARLVINQ